MAFMNSRYLALLTLLIIGSLSGCSGNNGPKTVEASGVLTLDGEPIKDAQIVFVALEGTPAYGSTDANGKFSMKISEESSGAVPGTYPVIVSKTKMEELGGGNVKLEQGLPEKYGNPAKSGLSVTIPESGSKSIKLELDSKSKK